MTFDFWGAQQRARSRTTLYVTLFIILTLVVATVSEMAMRHFAGKQSYDPPLPVIALVFMAITFAVAGYNYLMFQQYGGSYVAESLGGRRVNPQATNPRARQLINIVEEMALAASVPMPKIYILPNEEINAFAAGTNPDNAAIAITEGALNILNREEIQGVIAHEFGHIYNGDMKISMRLAAMVMGFFIVLYIGMRILQFSGMSSSRRSDENGERRGGNPIALAAIILMIAGVVTWFFGSILKAAVSREREYLADACAVQFTRSGRGIANALRKIGRQTIKDMPSSGMAYSHLYLSEEGGLSDLFATHPPLRKRIEAIEGKTFLPDEWKRSLMEDSSSAL